MKSKFRAVICASLLACCQAYAQIPSDGLVAYYSFNGNANDTSGHGFHGTLSGQTSVASGCGTAYYFLNNNIDCGDPIGNEFDLINEASVSLWVSLFSKPSSGPLPYNGYFTLIGKDVGPGNYKKWFLAITNDQLTFHVNAPPSSAGWATQTIFPFAFTTFYHIVLTKTANTYKFYVNGVNYGSQTMSFNIVDVPSSLKIGDLHDGSTKINAIIDEVLIYHKTLTQAEINQLYANCPAGVITSAGPLIQDQPGVINIFPNPTIGTFTVKMDFPFGFTDKKIRIINVSGEVIKQYYTRETNIHINIDKEGIYLVQIISNRKTFIKRLLVVMH